MSYLFSKFYLLSNSSHFLSYSRSVTLHIAQPSSSLSLRNQTKSRPIDPNMPQSVHVAERLSTPSLSKQLHDQRQHTINVQSDWSHLPRHLVKKLLLGGAVLSIPVHPPNLL